MADNLGIDIPEGKFARLIFKPVDLNGKAAALDGPITAKVTDDPADPATRVAVGPDGLTLDIDIPSAVDSIGTIEVDGDADVDPANTDVLTTVVNARRIAAPVGKAITLGGKPDNITFPDASQFGVFGPASARR